jgi:uncharacterized protein YndB with AHSA1/START domain
MTTIESTTDRDNLTLTLVAEFEAAPERVWQVWEDPRQLERWWGPPTWPATFEKHEPRVGGQSRYFMTGPGGEKSHGWWSITAVDAPNRLEFNDGFSHDSDEPNESMPVVRMVVTFEGTDAGTRMTTVTYFDSAEDLDKLVEMGMEEGLKLAMGQIDGILVS